MCIPLFSGPHHFITPHKYVSPLHRPHTWSPLRLIETLFLNPNLKMYLGGGRKFGSIQGSSSQVAYSKLGGKFTSSRYEEHLAALYHDCNSCTVTSIFVYATLIFSLFMQTSYQGANVLKFKDGNSKVIPLQSWKSIIPLINWFYINFEIFDKS